MTREDDLNALKRELLIEQLKYYRAANERRDREDFERRFDEALARRYGYPSPRRRRRD